MYIRIVPLYYSKQYSMYEPTIETLIYHNINLNLKLRLYVFKFAIMLKALEKIFLTRPTLHILKF